MNKSTVSVLEVKKAIARSAPRGGHRLIYRCPTCQEELHTENARLPSENECPTCGQQFIFSRRILSNWKRINEASKKDMYVPKRSTTDTSHWKKASIEMKVFGVSLAGAMVTLGIFFTLVGFSDLLMPIPSQNTIVTKKLLLSVHQIPNDREFPTLLPTQDRSVPEMS